MPENDMRQELRQDLAETKNLIFAALEKTEKALWSVVSTLRDKQEASNVLLVEIKASLQERCQDHVRRIHELEAVTDTMEKRMDALEQHMKVYGTRVAMLASIGAGLMVLAGQALVRLLT